MKLNEISDNRGAYQPRKRVGRGTGSGTGKTAGKGQKGQKSRSGVAIKGFEGGQMPLHRRLPKRGFTNIFRKKYRVVNLGRLQIAIDARKLDAGQTVTADILRSAGVIKNVRDGIRLLANGTLNTKITIEAAGASKAAIAAVEKAGGKVVIAAPKTSAAAPASASPAENGAGKNPGT